MSRLGYASWKVSTGGKACVATFSAMLAYKNRLRLVRPWVGKNT
ncbi:hypothetical protein Hsw_PA0026 (plasmid) [Hymenobacter swuensis DY53]|uniref:Uncharacterized protein n=1 Tax=Hymenobacter swuensis DY53 TaxID=1227739 RepID=W8EQA7_9BACT|nr:hypothetical protein Hsw_PA0026 [Hymenobacter swuensis DY53]